LEQQDRIVRFEVSRRRRPIETKRAIDSSLRDWAANDEHPRPSTAHDSSKVDGSVGSVNVGIKAITDFLPNAFSEEAGSSPDY
jgi:hypothetical protein